MLQAAETIRTDFSSAHVFLGLKTSCSTFFWLIVVAAFMCFLFILFYVILFPSMLNRQIAQCAVHIHLMIASRDMRDDTGQLPLATEWRVFGHHDKNWKCISKSLTDYKQWHSKIIFAFWNIKSSLIAEERLKRNSSSKVTIIIWWDYYRWEMRTQTKKDINIAVW